MRVRVSVVPGAVDLPLPAYATPDAAGLDLVAAVDGEVVVEPGARTRIPTGLRLAIPRGYEGQIRPRSGLALHHGILLPNAPGTIDADYRGEVQVIVWNGSDAPFAVKRGDRIAQLVIAPVTRVRLERVESLDATARGAGGFGHTGVGARREKERT